MEAGLIAYPRVMEIRLKRANQDFAATGALEKQMIDQGLACCFPSVSKIMSINMHGKRKRK